MPVWEGGFRKQENNGGQWPIQKRVRVWAFQKILFPENINWPHMGGAANCTASWVIRFHPCAEAVKTAETSTFPFSPRLQPWAVSDSSCHCMHYPHTSWLTSGNHATGLSACHNFSVSRRAYPVRSSQWLTRKPVLFMRTTRLIRLWLACFLIHAAASAQAPGTARSDEPLNRLAGNETRLCINADVTAATDVNAFIPALRQTTARQDVLSVLQSPLLWMRTNQTSWQAWCACLACVLVLASVAQSRIRPYAKKFFVFVALRSCSSSRNLRR